MTDELRIDSHPAARAARARSRRSAAGTTAARARRSPAPTSRTRGRRERVRGDRSRELLRLPGDAADGLARRRRDAPDRLAREHVPARAAARRGRDAIILLGVEPNLRWRTFSRARHAASRSDFGVELVVTLGSLLADVPHTRPAPVTGQRDRPGADRAARPAGVALRGADRHRRRAARRVRAAPGIPSASLWAAVPHYVSLTPSPRAAKALVDRLADLLDADVDTTELDEAADAYAQQVSEAVAVRRGDRRLRRGARAPRRRARRRGRPAVGRRDRRRADALPARARATATAATTSRAAEAVSRRHLRPFHRRASEAEPRTSTALDLRPLRRGGVRVRQSCGLRFIGCALLVVLWLPSYFLVSSLNTWQLIINTLTTIVTFLLVALLQNSQRRSEQAVQGKLDALADGLADLMVAVGADGNGKLKDDVRDLRAAIGLEQVSR